MHFRVRKPLYLRYRTLRYPEANRARDNFGADVQLNGQLYAVFCLPLARSPGFNFLAFVSFITTLRIFSISFLLRMCQQQTVLERPGKVRARHCIAGRVEFPNSPGLNFLALVSFMTSLRLFSI